MKFFCDVNNPLVVVMGDYAASGGYYIAALSNGLVDEFGDVEVAKDYIKHKIGGSQGNDKPLSPTVIGI